MIATPSFEWLGADGLEKTIWIVSGAVDGQVTITGTRLDGPGRARFMGYEDDDDLPEVLVLAPPHDKSVDRRGYIIYPSPGCWEFTVTTQQETITIVVFRGKGP